MREKKYHGYNFWVGDTDYFYETDKKYKTIQLAYEIIEKVFKLSATECEAKLIQSRLQKGTLELSDKGFYKFSGNGYGMAGLLSSGDMKLYLNN